MKGQRVLVIEDDPDILEIVQANLECAGYDVISAADGLDGIDKVKSGNPDLILLDVLLPEVDGWEVLRQIEGNNDTAGLPVIMLTCKSEDTDILRGLEEGAVEYITKPFYPEDLVASVKILLDVFDPPMRYERRRQLIERRQRLMGLHMGSGVTRPEK